MNAMQTGDAELQIRSAGSVQLLTNKSRTLVMRRHSHVTTAGSGNERCKSYCEHRPDVQSQGSDGQSAARVEWREEERRNLEPRPKNARMSQETVDDIKEKDRRLQQVREMAKKNVCNPER